MIINTDLNVCRNLDLRLEVNSTGGWIDPFDVGDSNNFEDQADDDSGKIPNALFVEYLERYLNRDLVLRCPQGVTDSGEESNYPVVKWKSLECESYEARMEYLAMAIHRDDEFEACHTIFGLCGRCKSLVYFIDAMQNDYKFLWDMAKVKNLTVVKHLMKIYIPENQLESPGV